MTHVLQDAGKEAEGCALLPGVEHMEDHKARHLKPAWVQHDREPEKPLFTYSVIEDISK